MPRTHAGDASLPGPGPGRCPICEGALDAPFFRLPRVPTLDGALGETREEALACPVGDVTLALCGTCCWIGNVAFEPAKLDYEKYHFSLHHSPAFEAFVSELVDGLTDRHGLRGARVLDVGCGSGDFLRSFARRSAIVGLGVDPSIAPGTEEIGDGRVRFERGVLEARHADFDAALVCCRHVLNSMPDPVRVLREIRGVAGDHTVFYLEVPHAERTFGDDIVWNLAYEHRSWFNEASFRVLCERAGFEVTRIGPCWRGEYLGAELRAAPGPAASVAPQAAVGAARADLERFARAVESDASRWRRRLSELHRTGRRVAIWGAGARALLFLCQVEPEHVGCVVDINPTRQGNYLAHLGVRIDPPESLRAYRPDLILISNAAFADEIRAQAAAFGLVAEMEVF